MTAPRDAASTFRLCPHLSRLDLLDGRVCWCEVPDGTSWNGGHRTSLRVPWWRMDDWPVWLLPLVLLATGLALLVALYLGQTWQDERCAQAAGTERACVGWVAP